MNRHLSTGRPAWAQVDSELDRFHLLIDSVTDYAIYLMDADGRIVSWNRGAERLKGYSEAEILGRPYAWFFTPADRERKTPQRILERARLDGRCEIEGWRVRKDGSRFWALAVVHSVTDQSGRHLGFAKVT